MKRRMLSLLLALAAVLSMLPQTVLAAELSPAVSGNINSSSYKTGVHEYSNATVRSYLYENSIGGLSRVEFLYNTVIVEDYDGQFSLKASRTIEMELPIWGGFFAGEQYNFIIFGQTNTQKDDSAEVIRVVKYDKNWKRLGSASMYGASTSSPFHSGSVRCDEYGGYLYIRTSHLMYNGHQANMMLSVRERDMTVTDSFSDVELSNTGYVSHSFDQYILIDQAHNIATLDLGDANPRALRFNRYIEKAGQDCFRVDPVTWIEEEDGERYPWFDFKPWAEPVDLREFPGHKGDNRTGCAVGGLADTAKGYVAAYTYDGYTGTLESEGDSDVYLAFVDKDDLTLKSTQKLSSGVNAVSLRLVSTGTEGGYVLWNEAVLANYKYTITDTLYYAAYDADGKVTQIETANAFLSDCRPICWKGKAVWYATNDSGPVFYLLDESGVERVLPDARARFTDLSPTGYYLEAVSWAVSRNITNGTGDGSTFFPAQDCTHGQILTFLWRAMGYPAADVQPPFEMRGNEYYFGAAKWAYSKGMIGTQFNAGAPCTRADAVNYIWQALDRPAAQYDGRFTDIAAGSPYAVAVAWALANNVTTGATATTFNPNGICSRGQIVTFLFRAYK